MTTADSVPVSGSSVGRYRWTHVIPVTVMIYVISFMDRTNISFGLTGMEHSLHIDDAQYGLAAGIFFIGYLFPQIPGGHLAEKWSARKFVGIMVFAWGIFAVASGLVQNFAELIIVRFFLGLAEGGIWPAVLVLISHWFPGRERARSFGLWMMNIAISAIITAPLSGWILSFGDWRTLFFVEGAFPFVIAAPIWWLIARDRPRDSKAVSTGERRYIEESLAAEATPTPRFAGYRDVFRSGLIWRLVAVYFLYQVGFSGLTMWLPHLITTITGGSSALVGAVTIVPYAFAIVALWLVSRSADKAARYTSHVMACVVVGAAALLVSVLTVGDAVLSMILVSIATAGILAYLGPFWASISRAMPPELAGGGMGLINGVGSVGAFVGPYLGGYLQDASGGSFLTTAIVIGVALILAGLLMLTLREQADIPAPGMAGIAGGQRAGQGT
ncbi:MAG TPA: MFS transporter [Trebonia sp.]